MGNLITKILNSLSNCCPTYFHSSCCNDSIEVEIKNDKTKQDKTTDCQISNCFSFHRESVNH
jgi:hypothetical protein